MPPIYPGYTYDIFISYRQNDNRSGWVAEFAKQLEGELSGTLKEKVTIFFDANLHHGLYELHDVDGSVKDKIKCFIFLPILSRTYCDSNSFAWQNEFLAFRNFATADELGLKIKLINGNVVGRILPVRIHDLSTEDTVLFEKESGGPIRAVDFVFRSAGVNRPLLPTDNREDNQAHTVYRDQLNKLANIISDLIVSARQPALPVTYSTPLIKRKEGISPQTITGKIWIGVVLLFILVIGLWFRGDFFTSNPAGKEAEKSIAVLPFTNLGSHDQTYLADGVMGEIINRLARIKSIRVVPATSVERYRSNRKSAREISQELNVSYLLDGSTQLADGMIKISVQLIKAEAEQQIWSETFKKKNADIFSIQAEIAHRVASALQAQITPEEKERINEIPTTISKAYDLYLRGKEYNVRFLHSGSPADFTNAIILHRQAISLDSNFANPYANIGLTYSWRELYYANPIKVDFLALGKRSFNDSVFYYANAALTLNPDLAEAINLLGWYYGMNGDFRKAESYFKKAMTLSNLHDNKGLGLFYMVEGRFEQTYLNFTETYLNKSALLPIDYTDAGLLYMHIGDLAQAESFQLESISLQPDFKWGYRNLIYLYIIQGRLNDAYQRSNHLISISNEFFDYLNMAHLLGLMKRFKEAKITLQEGLARMANEYGDNELEGGYIFWMAGDKEEGEKRLLKRLAFCIEEHQNKTSYAYKRAAYEAAAILAFLGRQQEAYIWLNKYLEIGFREGLENYILIDPMFETLRHQAEFITIVKQAKSAKDTLRQQFKQWESENPLIKE